MSILSVALAPRRRALGRPAVPTAEAIEGSLAGTTLADMATGERAAIVEVSAADDPAGARRLFDLGFVPGAEVRMVRRAPLADPVVFRVAGYDIALRREQARWVSVSAPTS